MRYIKPAKLTELEKLLIEALSIACQPGCSHERCAHKAYQDRAYWKGLAEAEKYKDKL